ncbi:MAG: insulinase family protein [Candidatus Tectomicrobia bacterium]|nr:insulinase family protein [Candidatus Tectomicrobia bacterium]
MRRAIGLFTGLAAILLACAVWAGGGGDEAPLLRIPWKVTEHSLPNGMQALLLPDRRAPAVVFKVWYRVGSREEQAGKTGLAHLLEHMMFRGTKKHGPKEFSNLIKRNGGSHNAFTSYDYTAYYERIAADRLELVMELEADRMVNLDLRQEEFEPERNVVLEERRSRTDDSPTSTLFEQVQAAAFTAHPYRNPIIGWEKDIRAVTLEDMKAFYRDYYDPANAIAVIVGDFEPAQAIRLLEKHFGPIPSRKPAKRPAFRQEAAKKPRRIVVRKEAELPYIAMAHHAPHWKSADGPALAMLEAILGGGETSRLYQRLVRKDQIALSAGADYTYVSVDPGLFYLFAQPAPGKKTGDVERALQEEMDRLIREGVPAEEMSRALRSLEAQTVFSMDSPFFRAMLLGRSAVAGDWRLMEDFLPALAKVKPGDVVRVAKAYLDPRGRTTGELVPLPIGEKKPRPPVSLPHEPISDGGR